MSAQTTLRRSLGLVAVVAFGFCFISPMGIFSLYGFAAPLSEGHLAFAYVLGSIAIFLTALSYGKMVKKFPGAGSAYTYARHTVGPLGGFLVGWSILLDYFLLPMLCVALAANYVHGELFPDIPMVYLVLLFTAIMTLINVVGIKTTTSFSTLLFLLQLVVVIAFVILAFLLIWKRDGMGGLVAGTSADGFKISAVVATAALICNTFLGFDAVTTLAEETKDPQRVVPKALLIVSAGVGALFTLIAFLAIVAHPVLDYAHPASASVELSRAIGGAAFGALFLGGCIVSSLASAVVTQASASRILYAMGRDGVLPRAVFGVLGKRSRVPVFPIYLLAAVSMLAAFIDTDSIASVVNFGAFTAFATANLGVIIQYVIFDKQCAGKQLLSNLMLPSLGLAVIVGLWTQLDLRANLLGLGWLGVGLLYAAYLTKGFRKSLPELAVDDYEQSLEAELVRV
jgi:putrescine importer